MLCYSKGVMFLQGQSGEFERNGQVITYQTGEFFQPDGGGSMKFSIDKDLPLYTFQTAVMYDLTIDISQFEYQQGGGSRKAFRVRVVDAEETQIQGY